MSATPNTPKADRLQLSLNGADRVYPYVSVTGASSSVVPLWISYAAFPSDVNRVNGWTIAVSTVNNRGTARGVVRVEYPPTQMPCALRATTSTTNTISNVNLSWLYTDSRFAGSFLIERSSNNGAAWRMVNGCVVPISNRTLYTCTDTRLAAGDYLYRACTVSAGAEDTGCSASNVTPPIRVAIQ